MTTRTVLTLIAGLLLAAASPSFAESESECADCLTAEVAREDLRLLYARLQEEHVDLFARRSREDYDAHMARLRASIEGPVTRSDFHLLLQDAMAFGQIGHAKTDAPVGDVMSHIQAGGSIIPLSITYRDDRMITDNWTSPEGEALPPGSRITRLGDLSVEQFEARLRSMVSADTDRLFHAQIELLMPALVFLVFGHVDALHVAYLDPEGVAASHTVEAMALPAMYAMQDERALPRPARDPSERVYRDLGNEVFYLQPGPFYAKEDERGGTGDDYAIGPFKAFVEKAFGALAESGARKLIIDLRNNPGGDVSFSDLIIARLTNRPYRFASRYEVRAGRNTKESWAASDHDPASFAGIISDAIAAAAVGERVSVAVPEVQPITDNAFDGKVWVLIDKHSFSNAAVIAALMQDLDIATLVGEETADLATTYGAVERFSLPNSGAAIVYPKAYMVRPSGDESVRGVVPDISISPNPIGEPRDLMLDAAAALARESD
jgi:hypothetical protein